MADDLHPQAAAFLDRLADANPPPTYAITPETARTLYAVVAEQRESTPVGDIQDFDIEGPAGPLSLRAYIPEGDGPFPTLVYYHGGGMVLGSLDSHDNVCTALCAQADVLVLSVDYRLAPEHPFPAPVEDAYAGLEWAAEFADHLGGDPTRLAVGGDSAGGRLTAATTLMARDRDGPDLAHQLLIYPSVASPVVHEFDSYEENGEGYLLERAHREWFSDKFIQNDIHARNAYLAPLLANDLSGLPSATVITAGFDPLRDEGDRYADRLAAAGVPVTHERYEGMIHGFVGRPEVMDPGAAALEMLAATLAASLSA